MASSSSSSYINLVAVLLVLSSAATVLSTSHRDAPAPAVDCSSLVLTMADCLSFVSNGSTVDKPEGTCCSGLKTVLKTDAECLCEAFKSSAQLGVVLNISKAMTLPSACKVSAASAAKCDLSIAPASSPGAEAPVSSPTFIANAPTSSEGASEMAKAPAPGNSAASSMIAPPSLALATAAALSASWFFMSTPPAALR